MTDFDVFQVLADTEYYIETGLLYMRRILFYSIIQCTGKNSNCFPDGSSARKLIYRYFRRAGACVTPPSVSLWADISLRRRESSRRDVEYSVTFAAGASPRPTQNHI